MDLKFLSHGSTVEQDNVVWAMEFINEKGYFSGTLGWKHLADQYHILHNLLVREISRQR
jgi:hypothetical protein